MATLWRKQYSKLEILLRVGDISQIASAQPFTLTNGNENGTRGVILRNAAGLELTVLTDRGMSLTNVTYRGAPVSFVCSVGAVHPAFYDSHDSEWLRSWPTGFLTPCGLNQVGEPNVDQGEALGLHGRISAVPARNVSYGGRWEGDDYLLWVEGTVRQTAMFGEKLTLTRRIYTRIGESRFWIEDRVENEALEPSPHMFLQHINLGYPLVDAETRLILPRHIPQPRDEDSRPGLEKYTEFTAPIPGCLEQVFYHDFTPDEAERVNVRLVNPAFNGGEGLGVSLRYKKEEFPVLVEWKMMRAGSYVIGLEPANCHVTGRASEREMGTLQTLEPGEVRDYHLEIGFGLGQAGLDALG